jgi:alginate O-acetyltransferase complex protein AlgI
VALFSIKYAAYYILNVVFTYIAGQLISKTEAHKKLFLQIGLIWLIGNLCFFKYSHYITDLLLKVGFQYSLLSDISDLTFSKMIVPLGLSYIIFRLIHYIVESYKQNLPQHSIWDMALYVLFFPTFFAGPVDRFPGFYRQVAERKEFDPADINYGLFRLISGVIKKFIIADSLSPVIMPILGSPNNSSPLFLLLSIYGVAIRIYMDFSGYTDMALGVSRLFGYRIMENFNYPFFKKNIASFWRNWHMSVYSFIRDYFFLPVFGYRASQLKIYAGMFFTMLLFCLWHEGSLAFFLLGTYHGLGLIIWQLFQELKGKNRKLRKIVDNSFMDIVSTFVTFNFVSFSMLVFYTDLPTIRDIFYKIFI